MLVDKDKLNRTELHYACVDADAQKIRALLGAGADPREADANGWTPLHFAAQANCAEGVEILIDAGATVDASDREGNTPLFRAVFNSRGDGAVITILLAAGADPAHENRHGVSPRSLAHAIANYDVARYFELFRSGSSSDGR
jgi:ankyrin repeat protein